jgi:hypothetical protein
VPTRLPAIKQFSASLAKRKTDLGKNAEAAGKFLVERREVIERFGNAEDLGVAAYGESSDPDARALSVHVEAIRNLLVDELWARKIFIGPEIIDDLLMGAVIDGESDPLLAVVEFLRDRRANRPGIVIFALHSFGILGAGLLRGGQRRASFIHPLAEIAISPQSNKLAKTVAFLEEARTAFGVHKAIPVDLLEHWHRSRAPWLERNPLLALRVVSQRGSYYSTEWLITMRVRAASALVAMLAVFQPTRNEAASVLFSTSSMNNWETLDIHHYFVLYDHPNIEPDLTGDAVPIHNRGRGIVELSELNVALDPSQRAMRSIAIPEIEEGVEVALSGRLNHLSPSAAKTVRGRTYKRVFDSLDYFGRSFPRGGVTPNATINLATAFEMLLTDHYSGGVRTTLVSRTGKLLAGVRGKSRFEEAVSDLYEARSEIVHGNGTSVPASLVDAQRAFSLAFARLAPRIKDLSRPTGTPIADLTAE